MQDEAFLLSRKSVFHRLKKKEVEEKSFERKYVKVLFAWNIPRPAARVFLGFVSKLKILRKGTISVHCTAINEVYL